MPAHKLTAAWTKIASKGQAASVLNSGTVPVDIATFAGGSGRPLPPGASQINADLPTDLFARCSEPKGEVVVEARDLPPRWA